MLKSSLCDYSDAFILVRRATTITGAGDDVAARQADKRNKEIILKNCESFTRISEINNTQVDDAKDLDVGMPKYNLIEYSDNHSKKSRILWKHYRVEQVLEINGNIANFPGNSTSFKFNVKMTEKTLLQVIQKMLK